MKLLSLDLKYSGFLQDVFKYMVHVLLEATVKKKKKGIKTNLGDHANTIFKC